MTISIDGLAVWLPGRGIAVGPLSFDIRGLTLLTGRSGTGASAVAGALGGALPAGALVRGSWTTKGVSIRYVGVSRLDLLLDLTVAEALGDAGPRAEQLWGSVTGLEDLGATLGDLDPATCAVLPALRGVLGSSVARDRGEPTLLVLDQPMTHLLPDLRVGLGRALRRCADGGVDICWVEHDLAVAVPQADHVVELLGGGDVVVLPAERWSPRTLPLPPEAALSRALGHPRAAWWDLEALGQHPAVSSAVPTVPPGAGRAHPALTTVPVPAVRAGVGHDLEVVVGETLGIVPGDGDRARALAVARRLAATLDAEPGPRPPLTWPAHVPLGRLARTWCGARGGDPAAALDRAARVAPVDHTRTLAQHSPGERRAVVWALSAASAQTEVLDQPEAGLDAEGRRLMATALRSENSATATVVVSHDPELLVRACHRLLVLPPADEGTEAQAVLGPPALVADHLPHPPALRRAGSRALRVRDVWKDAR
ncbi:ABC transporter ATP-binding protein [Nocardioides marmotae]|uniref:ATP-binding cassette domain-containing protein n=1 Tax=Nocardioides marmotae TaxID=2663857 RepID=A0A6I3J9E0_9ACTN|nr:ABC transporter ATP-binding protein [Nocardioides marmotae]MCR6030706.1 hypothetical protein [Gordonia jinghuaiqii]MBC9734026.1 hypothetical protein [Nocardioides marmotae]MTB85129.1 hypothetical protein [Nocardioides marmotae]MTB94340.1 hypothetical protein [Nocardioides marmotae]QKE01632.1 hypothetical protein HPC71_11475 [Nocardioides marmotae]